jgi:hypothetical protein
MVIGLNEEVETGKKKRKRRERILRVKRHLEVDFSRYEYTDQNARFYLSNQGTSLADIMESVKSGQAECSGYVSGLIRGKDGGITHGRRFLDSSEFREALKAGDKLFENRKFRESFFRFREGNVDVFGRDLDIDEVFTNQVQNDFVPALGGPFYKQLYQLDYLRMHNLCFFASNHDPVARFIVNTVRDFTLGRGFEIQSEDKRAMAVWKAFESANQLQQQMEHIAREATIYGEIMVWKLPSNQSEIRFNVPETDIPRGLIPRVRLIDPSNIWEIVTIPEDINHPIYYVWLAPTQWQTYTGLGGSRQPTSKFIFQTIDADQVMHYKLNSASNEKRGRSDLFPVLGYLKRLRDAVNYSLLSHMKQSAWSIDTTVEGGQADLDAYVAEMERLGTIPNSASEFVHTDKVKRAYLSPNAGSGSQSETFSWCLSMISMGTGIPVSYLGTHLSGGQTRASAFVSTEPTAKKFEMRQLLYKRILTDLWDYVMRYYGLGKVPCDVILPEIIVQDRASKLKDLSLAEANGWVSKRTAAEIAAKELGIDKYDWDMEQEQVKKEGSMDQAMASPLSAPAGEHPLGGRASSEEKKGVADRYGF